MDPLSMTASIIAIIQLTATLTGYINDVRKATKEQAMVAVEAGNLYSLLINLRFRVEAARSDDPWFQQVKVLGLKNGPLDQFKGVLEKMVGQISSSRKRDQIKSVFAWTFTKPDVENALQRMERLKSLINYALTSDLFTLSQIMQSELVALSGRMEQIDLEIKEVGESVKGVGDLIENFRNAYASGQQAIHRRKILDWLSPVNPFKAHEKARGERFSDTGKWFFESQVFKDWKSRTSPFLCLYGTSGCGKTVLCSTIIEAVAEIEPRPALGYIYFDFRDPEHGRVEHLMRALLLQFALQLTDSDSYLSDLYSKSQDGLREPQRLDVEEALKNLVQASVSAYIVIDALDECQDRDELRTTLERMASWTSNSSLRLLFTTRPDEALKKQLDKVKLTKYYIPMDDQKIEIDISNFVDTQLIIDPDLSDWSEKIKGDIKQKLTSGAKGMFRWVVLQIRNLRTCCRHPQLYETLNSLPNDLYETYERDIRNMGNLAGDAFKILQWLTFSARPLRLKEVWDVLGVDQVNGSYKYEPVNRPRRQRDIFLICPSLITQNIVPGGESEGTAELPADEDTEVTLAHFSVKNYLTSDEIRESKVASKFSMQEASAHPLLAEVCLSYLLQFDQQEFEAPKVRHDHPFSPYAARYWYHHTSRISEDASWQSVNPLIRKLFNDKASCFKNWRQLYDPDRAQPRIYRRRRSIGYGSSLYYASLLGLHRVVSDLLSDPNGPVDINAEGGSFGNALQAACAQGHDKVATLLLDQQAQVDANCGYFGTALQAACYSGNELIVDVLLSKSCNVNVEGGNYGTALQAASLQGHETIVRKLLDRNVKVDSVGGEYWTALQAAASQALAASGSLSEAPISQVNPSRSQVSICELLVEKNADVNGPHGGRFDCALEAASYAGSEPIVQLLLRKGVVIAGQPGDRHNPLQAAAYRGHKDIVQLLLHHGAKIDDGEGVFGNALQAACFRNHVAVVQLLLGRDPPASTSAKSKDGETALHWAAMFGDRQMVQILLEQGLMPTERDNHNWTPVVQAWMYQRGSEAHNLLEAAAGISAYEGKYGHRPTRLVKALECSGMVIESDGVTANLENPSYEELVSGAQLRTDHPFTAGPGPQYFEVEILKAGPNSIIGIGLCDKMASRGAMPGWNPRQWAYHGDDGMVYGETGAGRPYGPTWGEGDTVGCGLDMSLGGTGTIFFTKNRTYLGDAFRGVKGRFFPVIGTREEGTKFKATFGITFAES